MSSLQAPYTSILEGYLTKAPPFKSSWWTKSKWRRRYFVLYGDVADAAPLLAYYESKEAFASNQRCKGLINLDDCINIYKHSDTLFGREDVISLETSPFSPEFQGRVFHLAPDSDLGSREYQVKWVEEIKKRLIKLGTRNGTGSSGYASGRGSSVGSRSSTQSSLSLYSIRSRISSRNSRGSTGSRSGWNQPLIERRPVEHVNRPDAAEHCDNGIPEEETEDAN